MNEPEVATTLPDSSFGDSDCCGCLAFFAEIKRTLCATSVIFVVRTVPSTELRQTLTEMQVTLDLASAVCSHCGTVKLIPGFSKIFLHL
jgi:hypothetical protein